MARRSPLPAPPFHQQASAKRAEEHAQTWNPFERQHSLGQEPRNDDSDNGAENEIPHNREHGIVIRTILLCLVLRERELEKQLEQSVTDQFDEKLDDERENFQTAPR